MRADVRCLFVLADFCFSQPLIELLKVVIKFLLDIRHRPIEDVVFDKVKLVKPLDSNMLKPARHVDALAAPVAH